MNHLFAGAAATAFCVAIAGTAAQTVQEFELVSVRRSPSSSAGTSGTRAGIVALPGGRFEARRQTLADLARVAFGFEQVDPARGVVESDDPWVSNDRFDITAASDHQWTTPPPGTTAPPELRTMLKALLEERFALKARISTRNMDVIAVRLVSEGVLGPGLRQSAAVCLGPFTNASPGEAPPRPRCPFTQTGELLQAEGVTMADVAQLIARIPRLYAYRPSDPPIRILVDQTNLTGRYDMSLRTPVTEKNVGALEAELRSVAILGALETQLGLKLERARAPVPTLTIESARKPKED